MGKERSCTHNHDAMRRELRDKELPPTPCPVCDWLLSPAKDNSRLFSDRLEDFILWMEDNTDFGSWDQSVKTEVHMKLIEFLT